MSRNSIVGVALLAAVLAATGFAFARINSERRAKAFNVQLDDASNDIAELLDKIGSDQVVFDLADDRAVVSTQKLRELAYTDKLRQGSKDLAAEVSFLRACRAARNVSYDEFQKCLERFGALNDAAWKNLPEVK